MSELRPDPAPRAGATSEVRPTALDFSIAHIVLMTCASVQDAQQGGDGAAALRRVADWLAALPGDGATGAHLERLAELLREPCDANDRREARAVIAALRRPAVLVVGQIGLLHDHR